jgi:hypothetical protein
MKKKEIMRVSYIKATFTLLATKETDVTSKFTNLNYFLS